jgi:hypothetical protein
MASFIQVAMPMTERSSEEEATDSAADGASEAGPLEQLAAATGDVIASTRRTDLLFI